MDGVVLLSQGGWAFLHAEGGPFDPCDKLIHPSICVNFHPVVGIDSLCVSLHACAGPSLDDHPNIERPFRDLLEGHMRPFGLTFTLGLPPSVWGSIGESPRL